MPLFLEIARAACMSLSRTLGLWLLGLAALAAVGWFTDLELTRALVLGGVVALVIAAVPVVVGTGLRRWVRSGPLGLVSRGAGYWATVGYGLGAGLVALPFILLAVRVLDGHFDGRHEALAAAAVLIAAWLGASAGRLVQNPVAVAGLSWVGAGMVAACATIVGSVGHDMLAGVIARGALLDSALLAAGSLASTHLIVLGAAYADQRTPTHREP